MSKKKGGLGKFVVGAAVGAGIGMLFTTKKGAEIRKELKVKFDEFVKQVKDLDVEDVKKEFNRKVKDIKKELADLDKEKALEIAKKKGKELQKKSKELVALAKEKGTPVLMKTAEDLLEKVVVVSNEALKKLDEAKK